MLMSVHGSCHVTSFDIAGQVTFSSSLEVAFMDVKKLSLIRAILARVPRDTDKGHRSPTSVPGWSKLQIGVVVKAVRVRVS
jgi:hypothetical protein